MSNDEFENNLEYFLLKEFGEYGYEKSNRISQSELCLFLNRKSPNKRFDSILSEKLFNILGLNEASTISIEQSIFGIIKLENEIKNNIETIKSQYLEEKEIYNNLLEQCEKYKSEKLNEEGFNEEGKLYGEIIDFNLKTKLEENEEIIIKLIYSGQEKEIKLNSHNLIENEKNILNIPFEFRLQSKKDNLEIILQGKNEFGNISNLGSKIYSLLGLDAQDIFVKIPENSDDNDDNDNDIENEEKIIAEINAKIKIHDSYFNEYDLKRKEEEEKLKKLKNDLDEAEE